jgi:hypothetical protein
MQNLIDEFILIFNIFSQTKLYKTRNLYYYFVFNFINLIKKKIG